MRRWVRACAPAVEQDIASLLNACAVLDDPAARSRLHHYHRKIDLAHRFMTACDDRIDKATRTRHAVCAGLTVFGFGIHRRGAAEIRMRRGVAHHTSAMGELGIQLP